MKLFAELRALNAKGERTRTVRPEHEALEKRTWFLDRSISKLNRLTSQIQHIQSGYKLDEVQQQISRSFDVSAPELAPIR